MRWTESVLEIINIVGISFFKYTVVYKVNNMLQMLYNLCNNIYVYAIINTYMWCEYSWSFYRHVTLYKYTLSVYIY